MYHRCTCKTHIFTDGTSFTNPQSPFSVYPGENVSPSTLRTYQAVGALRRINPEPVLYVPQVYMFQIFLPIYVPRRQIWARITQVHHHWLDPGRVGWGGTTCDARISPRVLYCLALACLCSGCKAQSGFIGQQCGHSPFSASLIWCPNAKSHLDSTKVGCIIAISMTNVSCHFMTRVEIAKLAFLLTIGLSHVKMIKAIRFQWKCRLYKLHST